jgi:hypothetical protein
MTEPEEWSGLNKAEIIRRAQELDTRRQAQIARQIDSINRLIDAQGSPRVYRYEHELMTLNEKLALTDIRVTALERALNKVAQKVRDRLMATKNGKEHSFLDGLYQVLVVEAGIEPYDGEHGRTPEGNHPDPQPDPDGQEARVQQVD